MASAEKLLIEAEFAFRNITPGSTDERKFTARAKRYASRLTRKYPGTPEAEQAQSILRHLGVGYAATRPRSSLRSRPSQPFSPSPHVDHTPEAPHRHSDKQQKSLANIPTQTKKRAAPGPRATNDDSWANIWRIFLGLSYTKKKILAFVSLLFLFVIGFTPFLLVFFLYYAMQPAAVRGHLYKIVTYFA